MTNFKKIYTADYSAEGYDDGVNDGRLAKPKSQFGVLKINFMNYIWRYNDAHDSYCKNYEVGYEKGQRVREGIYDFNSSSKHSSNLPEKASKTIKVDSILNNITQGGDMDSYQKQIYEIQQCIDALEKDKRLLDSSLESYRAQIKKAGSAGFYQNYTDPLDRKSATMQDKTDDLKETIDILIGNLEYFITKLEILRENSKKD